MIQRFHAMRAGCGVGLGGFCSFDRLLERGLELGDGFAGKQNLNTSLTPLISRPWTDAA
jgi:hypothetical protein